MTSIQNFVIISTLIHNMQLPAKDNQFKKY